MYGTQFAMASIPGRPYTVGFTFRIISATAGNSLNVTSVIEYNYNKATFALEKTTELIAGHRELGTGNFLEYTAGLNKDQYTVVYVTCNDRCQVRTGVDIYRFST